MNINFKVECPISGMRDAYNCISCKYGIDYDPKGNLDVNCNAVQYFLERPNFQSYLANHMDMTVIDALQEFIAIDRYDP